MLQREGYSHQRLPGLQYGELRFVKDVYVNTQHYFSFRTLKGGFLDTIISVLLWITFYFMPQERQRWWIFKIYKQGTNHLAPVAWWFTPWERDVWVALWQSILHLLQCPCIQGCRSHGSVPCWSPQQWKKRFQREVFSLARPRSLAHIPSSWERAANWIPNKGTTSKVVYRSAKEKDGFYQTCWERLEKTKAKIFVPLLFLL